MVLLLKKNFFKSHLRQVEAFRKHRERHIDRLSDHQYHI